MEAATPTCLPQPNERNPKGKTQERCDPNTTGFPFAFFRQAVRTDATSDGAAFELCVHVPGSETIGGIKFRETETRFGAIL
jgi:hypothetical protein